MHALSSQLEESSLEQRQLESDNGVLRQQLELLDKTFRPLLSAHLNALGIDIDGVSLSQVAHLINAAMADGRV